VPKSTLFAVFSGLANHITNAQLVPFMSNMHIALWCLAAISLVGAAISAARPAHVKSEPVAAAAKPAREQVAA
jgi:hypothetical protein